MTYKTKLGLDENIVAALSYVGFWITGIILLLIEPDNKFVRFHAMQSLLISLPLSLIIFVVGWIPYVGWIIADFLGFGALFFILVLVIMAYRGALLKIPVVGNYAYRITYQ
ncbi:DUF4870 domain-containing protein [Methanolobus bombayensis]|uniref:DUF4870 domain-containing protein n=1 Tax=Methanolobus bombayensis TaxID=38023 RepID=UPI001AE461C4|nr:hypothetical protein [Methanolobus bombayensis]MBP1909860.1 putative membrane protein [Methanolobus bombayensis]